MVKVETAKKKETKDVTYWEDVVASKRIEPTEDLFIEGERLYQMQCSICHGLSGQGNGPASIFLGVKPRDFTSEGYKFRTTTGSLPSDDDLFRTVTVGFPAYGMPEFQYLSEEDRWAIVHYIKRFNKDFKNATHPELVDLGSEMKPNAQIIKQGQEIFKQAGCYACHGETGQGDGPSSASLKDNQGRPILALDLTRGGIYFKGGDRPRDMVRTFMTGLKGTPMPSYVDAGFTKEQLWMLAHFLKSLSSNYEQGQ
ncbi:c-type cytochrome [PVC group bacterium]|nr:c-type cytochrome [PVC group bacterium]